MKLIDKIKLLISKVKSLPKKTKWVIIAIIGVQLLSLGAWGVFENIKLRKYSKTILVKTIPVNPKNYASGNYLHLQYEFGNPRKFIKQNSSIKKNDIKEVFAVLTLKDRWYIPDYLSLTKPKIKSNQVVLKGLHVQGFISYGIEKLAINKTIKNPHKSRINVMLFIDKKSEAHIKKVFINDEEFIFQDT